MDSRALDIIQRQERMADMRAIWDQHWREIAERILPRANFFRVVRNPGDKRTEKVFDATATLALERFAAAMESMLTPRTQRWHKLRVTDERSPVTFLLPAHPVLSAPNRIGPAEMAKAACPEWSPPPSRGRPRWSFAARARRRAPSHRGCGRSVRGSRTR